MKMCRWKFKMNMLYGRAVLVYLALGVMVSEALGQDGKAGIEAANKQVRGYFDTGSQLMYAVGAVVGLIGAVKVYQKWNSGDQDTAKTAASWFGSCIFLVLVTTIIKAFFSIS